MAGSGLPEAGSGLEGMGGRPDGRMDGRIVPVLLDLVPIWAEAEIG